MRGGRCFVSHNLAAVSRLCDRSLLIWQGQKITEGPTDEVLKTYVQMVRSEKLVPLEDRADRAGSGRLRFTATAFEVDGELTDTVRSGDDVTVLLHYRMTGPPVRSAVFSISISNPLGGLLLHLASDVRGLLTPLSDEGTVRCRIPRLPLPAGTYPLSIAAVATGEPLDMIGHAARLVVLDGDFHGTGRRPSEAHQAVLTDFDWSGPG